MKSGRSKVERWKRAECSSSLGHSWLACRLWDFLHLSRGGEGGGVDSAFGAAAKSSVFLARHDVK